MFNILYIPRLPNGKHVPLNWSLKLYRWTNIICWPLEDNAPHWLYFFDRFLWFLGFLTFAVHNDAELRYLRVYFNNLDEMLTGVPTYLVLIELHLRAFSLGWRKNDFKNLLKKFYAEIYIEESINVKIFKKIKRQMWPILTFSLLYFLALNLYIFNAVYVLATNKRELLYKMIPTMEYKNNFYVYFPLLMSNIWVGFIVTTMMFGEGNTLGLLIFNLNGRYLMMRETFKQKVDTILKSNLNGNIVEKYERVLRETLKENLRLNKFAREIQDEFSFRIFVMFSFSAISLCALGFKVYTSPVNSIAYAFWAIGKIQEILAFGQLGSTIISTTDQLSTMYYESKWEIVIERSSNTPDNIKLLKFVTLSIVTNRKPFHFTGLNFFNVSLVSVVAILQGAGSYFTFLISLR
ncbi:odorant receptor 74a-like [Lucilia cuprina]|uniref:odorant receptor 74a-like n=1 Tax=Lucilia cuprina TaxID=7375 RepID=UPI001F05C08B|nr:odorant receptor 74a-like [Lucilia cuprina]XP_046810744.1 odorant receptor 74a-like [Lucilia cuprina]